LFNRFDLANLDTTQINRIGRKPKNAATIPELPQLYHDGNTELMTDILRIPQKIGKPIIVIKIIHK
jgi:hypothetical protein